MSTNGLYRQPIYDDGASWTPEEIVALRKRLRWSQEKLARTIGRSVSAIQKLESGARSAGFETRRALDALALSTSERVS